MSRYLALATALVIATVLGLLAVGRPFDRSRVAESSGVERLRPGGGLGASWATPPDLAGDAPWALSALPECFRQERRVTGSQAYVAAQLTPGQARSAWRRVSGAILAVADCRLRVRADSADIVRRELHLRIPPVARFYVAGNALVLDRLQHAREDVRFYTLADGRAPAFTLR